jgi:lysophospholipase L1-like esterase
MKHTLALLALLVLAPFAALRADVILKSGEKVAFLGDSITAQGWSNAHGYVKLVVAGLAANGMNIVPMPAGIGGHKSNDMLARLQRDVIEKKPEWVTVSCGMNDVIHGAKGIPLDQYKANMTDIVAQCQAAGIKVMLFTTTTAGAWESAQSKQLGEYSAFLRTLAKDKNCLLSDLYPAFVEALQKADTLHGLTGDGVHMTPEGNMLIARTVLAALGLSEEQLAKARETWLDLPGAGTFTTRVDVELNKKFFTATCALTLRQRERVLEAAAAAKRPTLNHWSKELLLSLMKKKVEPLGPFESLDDLFAADVKDKVQAELQNEFAEEISKITSQ